ncbi:hypothetical protein FNU76_01875 [Chitinimonas arctica]|uniref:Uncharacterized protein n=1 Tax=Chitinimonas arctica TaxID=2594795 RepID=A0A516SAM0_9NEIS|nr:hypothetical protein [Chitinimonas arctica]QDQ25200.1 hypothetical protein FNU76_01875 [Chitinimonas arctica]
MELKIMPIGAIPYATYDAKADSVRYAAPSVLKDLPNLRDFKDPANQVNLLKAFGGTWAELDHYLGEARQAGKTDQQIRLLLSLLPLLSDCPSELPIYSTKKLVALGLFDEVTYNACAPQLINLLLQKDVLLHAFTRPGMLRKTSDFEAYWVTYSAKYYREAFGCNEKEYKEDLKWTELDNVLVKFAQRIGKQGFPELRLAHLNEANIVAKSLFDASSAPQGQRPSDYLPISREHYSALIGYSFERFMSESALRAADVEKTRPYEKKYITDGALYQRAFPEDKNWCCRLL